MSFEHIEAVAKRNRNREHAPGKAAISTEAVVMDVISKQFIQWRSGDRDSELMGRAEQIIRELRGAEFIADDLESIHKIYQGYFAVASRKLGYKPERGAFKKLTGKYRLELDPVEKLKEENQRLRSIIERMEINEELTINQLKHCEDKLFKLLRKKEVKKPAIKKKKPTSEKSNAKRL